MARGKRIISRDVQRQVASNLVNALKFVAVAQTNESDSPNETHCIMGGRAVVAFNGILGAGHLIDEDLTCCPHTRRLIDALERCGADLAITADERSLSLRSERFRVSIPLIPNGTLQYINPDPWVANVSDILKDGFKAVSCIVADASELVITASILLRAGSMVSTNKHVVLEYWHGIDLPPDLTIPKAAAMAVAKSPKKLTGLGFSPHSVTFWFEDRSWIRTQQYVDKWPASLDRVLNAPIDPKPLPALFYAGLSAVAPFCKEDNVYFDANRMYSNSDMTSGASYEVVGLIDGLCFSPKYLKLVEPFALKFDFTSHANVAYFTGERIRGAIAGKGIKS